MGCSEDVMEVPYLPYEVLLRDQLTEAPTCPVKIDRGVNAEAAQHAAEEQVAIAGARDQAESAAQPGRRRGRGGRDSSRGRGGVLRLCRRVFCLRQIAGIRFYQIM